MESIFLPKRMGCAQERKKTKINIHKIKQNYKILELTVFCSG